MDGELCHMVGIDIGSKSIKIVELEKSAQGFSLLASGIVGYSGSPVDKLVDDKEIAAVSEILRKLHKEAGVSSKDVNISIPESQVFTRTIKFPLLTDAEVASAIKWESEQYIPIPIAEAVIQHTILERNETSTPPRVLALSKFVISIFWLLTRASSALYLREFMAALRSRVIIGIQAENASLENTFDRIGLCRALRDCGNELQKIRLYKIIPFLRSLTNLF